MILHSSELREIRSRIALDIGNVLFHVDMDIFINELYLLGIPKAHGIAFTEEFQSFLDVGHLNMEQALRLRFPKLSLSQIDRAKEAWFAIVTPCKPTINVVTELIAEGAQVALLSNIGIDHATYISDMCSGQFEHCIKHFSCDVGARKPTKIFYQSFINDYNDFSIKYPSSSNILKQSRGLFLDDRLENIEAARKYMDSKIFDIEKYESDHDAAEEMVRIIQSI